MPKDCAMAPAHKPERNGPKGLQESFSYIAVPLRDFIQLGYCFLTFIFHTVCICNQNLFRGKRLRRQAAQTLTAEAGFTEFSPEYSYLDHFISPN